MLLLQRSALISILCSIGFVQGVSADTITPMSLADMIMEMKSHNPSIEQNKQYYAAAKAVIPQILAPNNPQIGFIENPIPGNPISIRKSQGLSYTLTQSFPFPGKKELAAKIADNQAESINTQTQSLEIQLESSIKIAYYQLQTLQHQSEINRQLIERLEQIKQIAKVRYSNNAAAYVDYLNAQVAQSSAKNDDFALQTQILTTSQMLNTLIGREPSSPLNIQDDIPNITLPKQNIIELENLAIDKNPAIRGSEFQINAAQSGVDLAKKAYYPDFQVIFTSISDNPPYGMSQVSNYGLELDLVLPTWFLSKEKAGVKQAQATMLANRSADTSLRQQIKLSVDTAYNQLTQALNQTQFIRTRQLEEAKTAFRLALTNYANNALQFNDLMTAQTNLHMTEIGLLQSENNIRQAYASLEAVIGGNIEQNSKGNN